MPDALTAIGEEAFCRCEHLTSVVFNEGLESIGDRAFCNAPITTVNLPSTLKHLGKASFDVFSDYMEHTQNIYISIKAAPPFWPAIYGNRHTLPRPTAEPAVARMMPILLPKFALSIFDIKHRKMVLPAKL